MVSRSDASATWLAEPDTRLFALAKGLLHSIRAKWQLWVEAGDRQGRNRRLDAGSAQPTMSFTERDWRRRFN